MTVSLVGSSLASEEICLFVDLWKAQPCLWDPKWYSSYLNYPERDYLSILTWLSPTFWIMLSTALLLQVQAEACMHLFISQLRMKHSSSYCPNHVRWTKSLIKKQIIVHRTVLSMFSEQTVHPIKNGLKALFVCSVSVHRELGGRGLDVGGGGTESCKGVQGTCASPPLPPPLSSSIQATWHHMLPRYFPHVNNTLRLVSVLSW